ncbi:hypothetical protein BJV82DRAFT_614115 [Fennellomyces sp. T-0311]|nr:hypothetical protein BJV82DRAFT_614115 [Fennellomyces sp. T-0311]
MAEEKNQSFTAVSFPESKDEQEQLIHCRKPSQQDEVVDDVVEDINGSRVSTFRRIVILVTCSILGFFCLNGLILQMYPIGSTCPKNLKAMLDYPNSFPRMVALTQLDASMWFLAKRYAEEYLGNCYVSNSYIPTIPNGELPELFTDPNDGYSHNVIERPVDTSTPVLSFSVADIQALEINAGHGIAVAVYIEDAQNSNITHKTNQSTHDDLVNLYFKEYDDEDNTQKFVDIHWKTDGSGSAAVNFLPSQATNSTVQCILKIVLPNVAQLNDQSSKTALQDLSISIKEGRILAEHVAFDHFTARVGRGLVEARSIRANRLIAAVLDGEIALYGPKIKQALAAGVIRGSSTVLAKVDADHSKFDIINMCSSGYTYTDVMMTENSLDYFAADFYVYRDNGAPKNLGLDPMITIDGDVYGSAPQGFAHIDDGSTNVYKTGYMGVSENSGSHILVYSGAKTPGSRTMNSRFLYGLYYENTEY